jgi:hypothetical protein
MSLPTSRHAYNDCFELFDRALASARGVRTSFPSEGTAKNMIVRLHYARNLLRRESREIYPEGDPSYGTSPYDHFVIRHPREQSGKWWVYLEPRLIEGEVEELEGIPTQKRNISAFRRRVV